MGLHQLPRAPRRRHGPVRHPLSSLLLDAETSAPGARATRPSAFALDAAPQLGILPLVQSPPPARRPCPSGALQVDPRRVGPLLSSSVALRAPTPCSGQSC